MKIEQTNLVYGDTAMTFEFFTFCMVAMILFTLGAVPAAYHFGKAQGKKEYIDRVSEIFGGEQCQ